MASSANLLSPIAAEYCTRNTGKEENDGKEGKEGKEGKRIRVKKKKREKIK